MLLLTSLPATAESQQMVAPMKETQMESLTLAWPNPGCCGHLQGEPWLEDLALSACISAFQTK